MMASKTDPAQVADPFAAVRGAAHRWRGECIGHFAEIEQQLSAILIRAQYVPTYAALKPAFPHLVGQKYERLRKLLALDGPMKCHDKNALAQLDVFSTFDELRTTLCHGELEVGVTENDRRIFLFKTRNFKNKISGVTTLAFTQSEADIRRHELQGAAATLKNVFAALEKCLPRSASAPA